MITNRHYVEANAFITYSRRDSDRTGILVGMACVFISFKSHFDIIFIDEMIEDAIDFETFRDKGFYITIIAIHSHVVKNEVGSLTFITTITVVEDNHRLNNRLRQLYFYHPHSIVSLLHLLTRPLSEVLFTIVRIPHIREWTRIIQ